MLSRGRSKSRGSRHRRSRVSGSISSISFARSRRRSLSRRMTTTIPAGMGFISPRQICKLKYAHDIDRGLLLGGASIETVFNLNSVFAPVSTAAIVGSHQPYGFDQLANLYNRYRVFKTTWKVQIPSSNDQQSVAIVPVNGVFAFTNAQSAVEQPRGIGRVIGGGMTAFMKGKLFLPKLTAKPSEYRNDDRYESTTIASPTEVLRLHYVHQNIGTATIAARFNIIMTFRVEFYDEFTQAPS